MQNPDDFVLIAKLFRKSETNKLGEKQLLKAFLWGFYGLKVSFFHKFSYL